MSLEKRKVAVGVFVGVAIGVVGHGAWSEVKRLDDVEERVVVLEEHRISGALMLLEKAGASGGLATGPGQRLVEEAQARLVASLGAAPPPPGRGCEGAPAPAARDGAAPGVSGAVSALEWFERRGGGP